MAEGTESTILNDIKAMVGLTEDYTPFDVELLIYINSAVANLRQLNVGPEEGLMVLASTTWSELLEEDPEHKLENVKTYIFLKTKLVFDSSSMGAHHFSAYEKMVQEYEWRINHAANPAEENMLPKPVIEEV